MSGRNPFFLICCTSLFLSVSQCGQVKNGSSSGRGPQPQSAFSDLKPTQNFINEVDTGEDSGDSQEDEQGKEHHWQEEAETVDSLTRDYSTLPTSSQVTTYLNNQLSPPRGDCDPFGKRPLDESSSVPRILQGARLTLANYFQSCDALKHSVSPLTRPLRGVQRARQIDGQKGVSGGYVRKITNREAYVESHEVLNRLSRDSDYPVPGCRDMTKRPPVYGYGSRPGVEENGRIDIFEKGGGVASTSAHASGVDCSAFISTAMATSGMKVHKDDEGFRSHTTRTFHAAAEDPDSCLGQAEFQGSELLKSGDMVNLKGSHILMIDEVGSDPLAVNQYAQRENCQDIAISDFDFTYVHSGAIKGGYGPSRVHSSTHRGGRMFENLRLAAVNMCSRLVNEESEKVSSDSVIPSSSLNVIRHKSDEPECLSDSRVQLEGEECVLGCENIRKFPEQE